MFEGILFQETLLTRIILQSRSQQEVISVGADGQQSAGVGVFMSSCKEAGRREEIKRYQ